MDRLTPDQRSKQGALWNSVPCKTRNWELQVQFKVTGTTKVNSKLVQFSKIMLISNHFLIF